MDSVENSVYFDCPCEEQKQPESNPREPVTLPDRCQTQTGVFQVVTQLPQQYMVECVHGRTKQVMLKGQVKDQVTIAGLVQNIKRKTVIKSSDAIYVFTESGKLLRSNTPMTELLKFRGSDGIIRLVFSEEETFGTAFR